MRVKLLAALLSLVCANAFGAVADDIKALMEENKFTEAYQLGKQNPDQLGLHSAGRRDNMARIIGLKFWLKSMH